MIKLFGLLDVLTGLTLTLLYFGLFKAVGVVFAIYLLFKGLVFLKSLVSILDIISGCLILLAVFGHWFVIDWVVVVWLIQKGIFSFL